MSTTPLEEVPASRSAAFKPKWHCCLQEMLHTPLLRVAQALLYLRRNVYHKMSVPSHWNFPSQAFEGIELDPPIYDDNLMSMLEYGADPKEMDQAGAEHLRLIHRECTGLVFVIMMSVTDCSSA